MNLKILMKCKKGSILIGSFVAVLIILMFTALVFEIGKIYSIYDNIEFNMQRAANSAVEFSMQDEYRSDESNSLDISITQQKFLNYLINNLGLDSRYIRKVNGVKIYQIAVSTMPTLSQNPAQLKFQARLLIYTTFANITGKSYIELPVTVYSTNLRTGEVKPIQ